MPVGRISVSIQPSPTLGIFCPMYNPSQKQGREKYKPFLNETVSTVDHVYFDHLDCYVDIGPAPQLPDVKIEVLPTAAQVVKKYRLAIDEHFERRVAFFFYQMVCCYQSKLHFEIKEGLAQGASPKKVVLQDQQGKNFSFQRNAAHSQTLPCLIAYDAKEWALYEQGEGPAPQGYVYLKGTDAYKKSNSTMNMPRWVNNADIMIDGKGDEGKLRTEALALINRVSQGELTPEQGISEFLALCSVQIDQSLESIDSKKEGEKKTLKYYKKNLEQIQDIFENNAEEAIQRYLDVNIDPGADESLRKTICHIRYRAIRDSQIGQATILQKIDEVRKEIMPGRKPNYFDEAFRALLVEQATTDKNRHRLIKLLAFSPHDYAFRSTKARQTGFNKIKEELSAKHLDKINFIALEVLNDMRSLQTKESYQRSRITKELRHAKQWTQIELGQKVKEQFPHAAASQPTIHRIESRKKIVTAPIAQELSQVFGVDAGLLMPHFFYA